MAFPLQATTITALDTLYLVALETPLNAKARKLARMVEEAQAICEEINSSYDLSTAATSSFSDGGA